MPKAPPVHRPSASQSPKHRNQRYDAKRDQQEYRRWYKTARWQELRWSILVRDMFQCQQCGKIDASKGAMHCDHVEPHRGNEQAFWAGPFKTLCARCHNSGKQRHEASLRGAGPP